MKNNKYTVAIVDDEILCIDILRNSLNEYSELHLIGTSRTFLKGKTLILEEHPDLVFIDIELSKEL